MVLLEAVAVSLIGLFVAPVITNCINAALKYVEEQHESLKNVNPKLKELAGCLNDINDIVVKVQLCFIKHGTGEALKHLRKLKGAIDAAKEILDLFEYERLRNNNRISSQFAAQFTGTKKSPSRLEKLVEELGELLVSTRGFLQNSGNIIDRSPIIHRGRATGPSPETFGHAFFGYTKKHIKLKDLLNCRENKVIAIIGHGGMGKTHLARQVFEEFMFDVRIWAHVCNKFDQIELLTVICKSAIDKYGSVIPVATDGKMNLTQLESKLKDLAEPMGYIGRVPKKCLVVLDDVWHHEEGFGNSPTQGNGALTIVLAKLKRLKNCKVVMTTRAKICSTTLTDETIVLDGIRDEQMTELLKDIARPHQPPEGLAERIGKLKGSPRAAVSIVEKLNIASEDDKTRILDDLGKDHHVERLYEDHLFTYHHLPLHLQSCLAFCSMFPYNWRFEPEKLTNMWIAHGFIDDTKVADKQPHEKLTIEDVAEGYFKDLVDRSLFSRLKDGCYVIHVHIHSMIRRASGNECLSISSDSAEKTVPARVRHLSVAASCLAKLKPLDEKKQVKSKKKCEDEFRMVRTLLVFRDKEGPSSLPWSEAKSALKKFKGVRVLDLTDTNITQLPDIGDLKHLRYLAFPTTVNQPPAQVTKLLLLETLLCVSNPHSPADKNMECIANICGIRKLEKLRGSLEFHIHKERGGHEMSELAKMNSLSRTLSLKGIQTIATKAEAQMAKLEMKSSLRVLKLDWELNQDACRGKDKIKFSPNAVDVLEGLQPHANLRELHITKYPGKKLPAWLWDVCRKENLKSLHLKSCPELKYSLVKSEFPWLNIVIGNVEMPVPSGAGESTSESTQLKKNDATPVPALSSESKSKSADEPPVPQAATTTKPTRWVGRIRFFWRRLRALQDKN